MIMYPVIAVVLIIIDQITKWLTVNHLKPIHNIDLIPNVLSLTYVENKGAAFGILQDARWVFIVVTFAVLLALGVYIIKNKPQSKLFCWSCALIYAGAIGNLIDRVALGYVVDMIRVHFFNFPVFNFADCCVVIGAALLCIHILIDQPEK